MNELEKQEGTSSMLHQAMSIISKPSLNSNGSFSLETLNSVENRRLFSFVTLKFDGWPCKTIGHLLYVTSSFVHHFTTIGEFKLELQSRNAQFGSKSVIFRPVRPWNMTDDLENNWYLLYATSSFVHHFTAINEFIRESGNVQFGSKSAIVCPMWPWNVTDDPKNNRSPLLYYFNLRASFRSHL